MLKLSEIASKFDYQIVGEESIEICGINWAERALPQEIAVAYSAEDIQKTDAAVVLTHPCLVITNKTLIFCDDYVELAMIKIAEYMIESGLFKNRPQRYENYQFINGSMISSSAFIGSNTRISPFSIIEDDVHIGENCIIESNVTIHSGAKICDGVIIHTGSVIGGDPYFGVMDDKITAFHGLKSVVIEENASVGTNTVIQRGVLSDTVIGKGSKIGDLVVIGHDTIIGKNCKIVSQSGISGCVTIGDHTVIFGQSGVANGIHIGNNVTVNGKTSVIKDIPDDSIVSGMIGKFKNKKEC